MTCHAALRRPDRLLALTNVLVWGALAWWVAP